MNTTFLLNRSLPQRQQGAVLIVSLILLVILTMLGISAMESTKLETKMAVNTAEVNRALQIAEVGLTLPVIDTDLLNKSDWQPWTIPSTSSFKKNLKEVRTLAAEGFYPSPPLCAGNCSKRMIIQSTGCSQDDCDQADSISPQATLQRGISYGPVPVDNRSLTE